MTDKFATLRKLNGERTRIKWADLSNNRDIDATVIWDTGPEDTLKHNANPHDGIPLTDIDYRFCCEAANQMDALLGELQILRDMAKEVTEYCDTYPNTIFSRATRYHIAAWKELTNGKV